MEKLVIKHFFILFGLLSLAHAPKHRSVPGGVLVPVSLYSQCEPLGDIFFQKNQLKQAVAVSEAAGEYLGDLQAISMTLAPDTPEPFKLHQAATEAILKGFAAGIEGPIIPGLVPESGIEFPSDCMECTVPFRRGDGKLWMCCEIDYDKIPECILRGLRGQADIKPVVSLPQLRVVRK